MKRLFLVLFSAVIFVSLFSASASAKLTTKFYGYQWLTYQHQVKGMDDVAKSGLSINRTYLRWKFEDKEIGYSAGLTLDIPNSAGAQDGVDFGVWVKNGYVDFSTIPVISDYNAKLRLGMHSVYFGTMDLWKYPTIEKTITDKNKVISSADLGMSVIGSIPGGFGEYTLSAYNGAGYKKIENNVEKQYAATLTLVPIPGLTVRGSYITRNANAHGDPAETVAATDVFVQYVTGPLTALVEYVVKEDYSNGKTSEGFMTFLSMKATDVLELVARWDNWNPDTKTSNDEMNTYILGMNYEINSKVLLQLNYQLDQPQFGGYAESKHSNKWTAQVKYGW
ncbi:MAG TPA: hypothetical protein ENN55_00725 [Firmicutes bacterium]|nr:hypothetical protein [Bacillota bacterium]